MKRRKLLTEVIITVSVCSIIIVLAFYGAYQRQKRKQQERMEYIHRLELECVVYVTSGKNFIRDEDEITLEFNTKYVIMQVALYNECIARGVEKGEKISGYTEVQAEFNDYVSGRKTIEECKAINALFNFQHAEKCYGRYENTEQGITYSYDDYTLFVGEELKRNKGDKFYSLTQCSNDEMEAAAETAAKKWCDYMEGK